MRVFYALRSNDCQEKWTRSLICIQCFFILRITFSFTVNLEYLWLIISARGLEASHILDTLRKEIVFLTGGRDRQGGPLLLFPPHRDTYFMPNDITDCLKYLFQIPRCVYTFSHMLSLILCILILLCVKIPSCIASMSRQTPMDHFSNLCQSVHLSFHLCHLNVLTCFCSWHVFLRKHLFTWFSTPDCLYVEPVFKQYSPKAF